MREAYVPATKLNPLHMIIYIVGEIKIAELKLWKFINVFIFVKLMMVFNSIKHFLLLSMR